MDRTEAGDHAAHVSRTRRFLDQEAHLDRLLALTCGRAEPGRAAFELVAPLLWRRAPTNWARLMAAGLAPATVIDAAERSARALAELPEWSTPRIDEALNAVSQALGLRREGIDAVLSVFVLNGHTPLPPAAVFEVLGAPECQARLREAIRAYRAGQLVG
jgi:hypothetical protein